MFEEISVGLRYDITISHRIVAQNSQISQELYSENGASMFSFSFNTIINTIK